jgi:hypothetical protein
MVTAAHASVAAAHSSAAATATHPASAHRARATDAVTATAGVTATMLLTGVARVSARRLIDSGEDPFAAEVRGGIRTGRCRHCNQQAKRKNNTHAPILLFVMNLHLDSNARARPAPTSRGEKRGNET